MVKWLVFLIACHGHNPAFCPQGTADDGTCTDAGATCFGADPYLVCVASVPSTPLTLSNIDTTTGCDEVLPIGCLVAATDLTIASHITVRGSRPLVLFATGTITVTAMGILDVSGSTTEAGAGANLACATDATAAITKGGNGGGGGGGSFGARGGDGGAGGGGASGGLASSAVATSVLATVLEGGCDGDGGANGGPATAGTRGFGGGAVYLLAEHQLQILGAVDASGGGGGGARAPKGGGGGGGSGGMIVLAAPLIGVSMMTAILADGGGGGGAGANGNANGADGSISFGGQPLGGKGGGNSGDGGDGATAANAAEAGMMSGDGGGAGGGGAGAIHVIGGSIAGAHVSPAPS